VSPAEQPIRLDPAALKDRHPGAKEVLGRDVANTNARLRLKWAMD